MKVWRCLTTLFFCLNGLALSFAEEMPWSKDQVMVLCYHDIPKEVNLDKFGVDQQTFVQTIEYLRTHGFHFVSMDDILAAHDGRKSLPPKAVLLTFDDAYKTYYDFVFPLLEQYQYPSVLAVVSSWIDEKPGEIKQELMSWDDLREVAKSHLVEIATHTHNLHKGIVYNPQGNQAPAGVNRYYDQLQNVYEDENSLRQRIHADFEQAQRTFEERLGLHPRIIAWPYGKYNEITLLEAQNFDFKINFALNDQITNIENIKVMNRFLIFRNPDLDRLLSFLNIKKANPPEKLRILQVDLDLIYDPDPEQTEKNLSVLLDRVKAMKVSTVYLQAFADPQGTGNIQEVYFPNRVLPMRADLFTRVAHQLKGRARVLVYAWMPMLSIVLPDQKETEDLRVREYKDGTIHLSTSEYKRLSPFSPETEKLLSQLYEDLAVHSWLDGILFQDDGYLNDFEDFHPDALDEYKEISGGEVLSPTSLSDEQKQKWMKVKTQKLIDLTERLKKIVLHHDPECRFARNLYAPVLTGPKSEERFAQNYDESLRNYDYVVIMAYPKMEGVFRPHAWFKKMVQTAKGHPQGIEKTVFKVQTYDWRKNRWLKTNTVNEWLRELVAAGAQHLAYYPDDYTVDQPRADEIRLMMSSEDFPFKRDFE